MVQYDMVVEWDASLMDVFYLNTLGPNPAKGLAWRAVKITTGAPSANAGKFAPSALIQNIIDSTLYQNTGTSLSPVWTLIENASIDQETIAYNSDATAGALTISAARMINAILDRNGGSVNRSDTTATAALIVAAIPGAIVGSTFTFTYRNISTTAGEILTLAGGVGVTMSGNVNVVAGQTQTYLARVTGVGTPAVTLYAVDEVAGALAQVITASTVNTARLTTAATGSAPALSAVGTDTNIGFDLVPKGTGNIRILGGRGLASNVANAFAVFKFAVAPQSISGPGAVTLTEYLTEITTTGADAFTLANGTVIGMVKKIKLIVDGGNAVLTPVSLSGGTIITFTEVGDWIELMWNGTAWVRIDDGSVLGNGATPVLS